jgi:hypothetical protein
VVSVEASPTRRQPIRARLDAIFAGHAGGNESSPGGRLRMVESASTCASARNSLHPGGDRHRFRVAYRVMAAAEQTFILHYLGEHAKDARRAFSVSSRSTAKQGCCLMASANRACNRSNPVGSECAAHGVALRARVYPTVSSHSRRPAGARLVPGRARFFRDARVLPDALSTTGGSPGRRRPRRVPPRGSQRLRSRPRERSAPATPGTVSPWRRRRR